MTETLNYLEKSHILMDIQHLLLLIFWITYGLIHSVMASSVVKHYFHSKLRFSPALYRLFYNIVAFLGLAGLIFYQFSIKTTQLVAFQSWMWILFFIIFVPGVALMFDSIRKYFRQMSGLTNQQPVLVTEGPHRYIRHPLYAGTFLFIISLLILMPTLANLISVIVIISYTLIAIRFEEKKLVEQFGDVYKDYQQNVPMIIPRIKS